MNEDREEIIEIGQTERRRRRLSVLAFVAFYLVVSAALLSLFIVFTNSWTLAVLLVGFMVMYMALMGWLAMRKAEDRDL